MRNILKGLLNPEEYRFPDASELMPELELPAEEDFVPAIQDRILLEQIEAFVSRLEPEVQAVFRLRLWGERTFPEIAAILNRPESAVKSQYYRLLGRLRKEFDPHGT